MAATAPTPPILRLVSLNAAIPHIDVHVGVPLTLGRAPGQGAGAVPINHQSVSSRHASVLATGPGSVLVTDLGSSNGTFVNRKMRLQPHVGITLTHGMELSLVLPRSRKAMVLENDVSFVVHDMSVVKSDTAIATLNEAGLRANYEFLKELGAGTFGQVYLVRHKASGLRYAAKLIDKARMAQLAGPNAGKYLLGEITLLHKLRHPHIVNMHQVCETKTHVVILLQYATDGDLQGLLDKFPRGVGETPARTILSAIMTALAYLHEHNVIHRDLKPENVLLTDRSVELQSHTVQQGPGAAIPSAVAEGGAVEEGDDEDHDVSLEGAHTIALAEGGASPGVGTPGLGTPGLGTPAIAETVQDAPTPLLPKLADFGLAKACDARGITATVCGTPIYTAPEIMTQGVGGQGYDARVDVWAAGLVLWQLLTGSLPLDLRRGAAPLQNQILGMVKKGYVLPFPPSMPELARKLLSRMLCPRANRLTAAGVLAHPFLTQGSKVAKSLAPGLTRAPTVMQVSHRPKLDAAPGAALGGSKRSAPGADGGTSSRQGAAVAAAARGSRRVTARAAAAAGAVSPTKRSRR